MYNWLIRQTHPPAPVLKIILCNSIANPTYLFVSFVSLLLYFYFVRIFLLLRPLSTSAYSWHGPKNIRC